MMKNYLSNVVLGFLLDLSLWLVIIFCYLPLSMSRMLSAGSTYLGKHLKKVFNTNGNLREDDDWGTIIQVQGDCRKEIANWLYHEGIAEKDQIKNHMN